MRKSLFTTLDCHSETNRTIAESYDSVHQHAQLDDELGFNCLWVGEHHFFHGVGTIPNPAVLLGSLARSTRKIRLGPSVAVLPMRDATLIAGGRLNMGVANGSQPLEYQRMGIDFERRGEDFKQGLEKLKAGWTSADVGADSLNVRPIQAPMPPLFVATTTPEHAYLAGKEGFSVLTIVSHVDKDLATLQQVIEAHTKGVSDSDTTCSDAEVVVTVFAYAAESAEAALSTAAALAGRLLKVLSGRDVPDPVGLCRAMISRNTGLFGTTQQIAKQLDQYCKLGVEHISFFANFGGMSSEQVANSMRKLAAA